MDNLTLAQLRGPEPRVFDAEVVPDPETTPDPEVAPARGKKPRPLKQHQLVAQGQAAERRQQAWALRLRGHTLREIGAELGVSHESARKYISETLVKLDTVSQSAATEWRSAEFERKRELLKTWYPAALETSMEGARAVAVVLKLEERLAELMGVDAVPVGDRESEEQEMERCFLNEETMRIYAEYGVYAGDAMRDMVAACGGDPNKIPAPRRTFKL